MSEFKRKKQSSVSIFSIIFAFFFVLSLIFFLRKKTSDETEHLIREENLSDLNERQRKILELLSSEGEVTVEQLMNEIKGVTERTFRRDMKKLEELGLSAKQGNTKGSKYIYTN